MEYKHLKNEDDLIWEWFKNEVIEPLYFFVRKVENWKEKENRRFTLSQFNKWQYSGMWATKLKLLANALFV